MNSGDMLLKAFAIRLPVPSKQVTIQSPDMQAWSPQKVRNHKQNLQLDKNRLSIRAEARLLMSLISCKKVGLVQLVLGMMR